MTAIPTVRFDITGASGSQGLLSPKASWRAYVFPRGANASQDSTGTLITFDSAAIASRFAVNNWIQVGTDTAKIVKVTAVGGNSISVNASVVVTENDRVFLIGNTQPSVSGGSATYITPNSIVRQRGDDGADLYANSMITTNANGLVQWYASPAMYDVLVQDGNQSAQGYLADMEVGTVEGVSVIDQSYFGATVTISTNATIGQSLTISGFLHSKRGPGYIRYTSQFSSGSATAGISESIADLPTGGGWVIVDQSSNITSSFSKSINGLRLTVGSGVSLTHSNGVGWTLSGNDLIVEGSGDTSLLDFTSEAGATVALTFTGQRVIVRDLKLNHGRTNGASNNSITLNGVTTAHVYGLNVNNAGTRGIYTANCSDIHIRNNRITSSGRDGILIDTGITGLWIEDNQLTTCCVSETSGDASIKVSGNNSGNAFDSDIHISGNRLASSGRIGIEVNSSNVSYPTQRVFIENNNVSITGASTSVAGEGIAFTGNQIICRGNRVDKAAVVGILAYATCSDCVISGNIVSNSSQNGSATHAGIQLNANNAFGSGAMTRILVSNNTCFDDQGSPTQTQPISVFRGTSGSFSAIRCIGNAGLDNLTAANATVEFSNVADRQNVYLADNEKDWKVSDVAAVGSVIPSTYPTQFVTVSGGTLTITSTPTVADGYNGQRLTIINVDPSSTVTVQDQGSLPGSNLRLGAASRALGSRDNLHLVYGSSAGDWIETGFNNVI